MAVSATDLSRPKESGEALSSGARRNASSRAEQRILVVDRLFGKYRQRLLAYVAGLMGSVDDAEDVVQETYRRLLEVPSLDTDEVRVRAYLFRIATNLAYDRFRARRVRGSRVDLDECDMADDAVDPHRIVGLEQCIDVIEHTLGEIKPRCRQVFLLRATEHLSYEEIATRLGVSTRTVERDIRYVIELCQQRLKTG